jgi:hypothetical protein
VRACFFRSVWMSVAFLTLSGSILCADEMHEEIGSPAGTRSLEGQVLPSPELPFGGVINLNASQSTPWWPPRIVPPQGALNILLIMTDDVGFGVPSTFGGVIPAPTLDRSARDGFRYTQFHSTALGSPTRAALITGRNHHSVGFGVVSEQSTRYPGYDSYIGKDAATIGEILKQNGYATSWFGKNHNTPTFLASQASPFDQWPIGMGFEYFFGFVGGDTSQWHPNLFRNTTAIYPYFDKEHVTTPSARKTQHFEMMGDRPLYHNGWVAATTPIRPPWDVTGQTTQDPAHAYKWALYHVAKEWKQMHDLAASRPKMLQELQELLWIELVKYHALPLDASVATGLLTPRPRHTAGREACIYTYPIKGIPLGDAPNLLNTSYTLTAEIEIPQEGSEDVLATQGGRCGGWGFYHNSPKDLLL